MLISLSVPVIGGFFWNELKKPGPCLPKILLRITPPHRSFNSWKLMRGSSPTPKHTPGLKLSQMIIHTRVQGQASVITILALTMGFREWMQKNGGRIKFEEDEK